jgi:polyisoprenoid-binding protein YceI
MRVLHLFAIVFLAGCAGIVPAAPVAVAPSSIAGSSVPAALPQASDTSLDPAAAPAGAYALDARHANVIWRVRHMGLGLFTGRFDVVSGTLSFDPAAPENSSVNITIAANSVSTSVTERDNAFARQIANDVLDAANNPNMTFVSRSIQRTGPTTGLITGDLTIRGQTHPVTFETTFEGGRFVQIVGKHEIAFTARTIIDRTQWGAEFGNPIANATAGDHVEIIISAEFAKA